MVLESGQSDVDDPLDGTAEPRQEALGVGQLVRQVRAVDGPLPRRRRPSAAVGHGPAVALPGDQSTARTEHRQRQLDQLGERSHGPGRDHVVATAMASIVGHGFGTVGDDLERRAVETPGRSGAEGGLTGDLQEASLLGH